MKRVQLLLTYSLLGSVWLASCGGSNKKSAVPFDDAEGGEAGQTAHPGAGSPSPSAGTGNRSGAGGSPSAGEAGQASVAGAAGEGESAGASTGEGGSGGEPSLGSQGGEGGALICFNDLGQAGAPTDGIETGSAGAGSSLHVSYKCRAILDTLSPTYDLGTGNITLDIGSLGASAIAGGAFTARYNYLEGGEINHEVCVDGSVSVSGNLLTLPIEAPVGGQSGASSVWVTALALHDQCGNEAEYDPSSVEGDCVNLRLYNGEGGWQAECREDVCYPACGVILPPPTTLPPPTDPGL